MTSCTLKQIPLADGEGLQASASWYAKWRAALTGREVAEGPRKEFFYFTDNGDLTALRYADWKLSFKTIKGNLFTGTEESTNVPLVTNLRQDPLERYQDESMLYGRWWGDKLWTMIPAVTLVGGFLQTFKEYPPSQANGSISIEKALQTI